mgnify:FL=1
MGMRASSTGPVVDIVVYRLAQTNYITKVVQNWQFIKHIAIINNSANAITGGLKIGTTSGAVDVAAAVAVGANALTFVLDAALLIRFFSKTVAQTLFLQDVVAWNSANIDVHIICGKLY